MSGVADIGTNAKDTQTDPQIPVGLFNLKEKKKPHNIIIDNKRREPKARTNMKYTDKQRFRSYKTKTEPRLLNKIEINEDDDIVNKIKEALGFNVPRKNTNYSSVATAGVDYIPQPSDFKEPENNDEIQDVPAVKKRVEKVRRLEEDFSDISLADAEDITKRVQDLPYKDKTYDEIYTFVDKEVNDGRVIRVPKIRNEISVFLTAGEEDFISKELLERDYKEKFINEVVKERINLSDSDEMNASVERGLRRIQRYKTLVGGDKSPTASELSALTTEAGEIPKVDKRGRPVGSYGPNRKKNEAWQLFKELRKESREKLGGDFKNPYGKYDSWDLDAKLYGVGMYPTFYSDAENRDDKLGKKYYSEKSRRAHNLIK